MVICPLPGLEVDALVVTSDNVQLGWGYANGHPLSEEALRWVGWYLYLEIVEAL